MEQEILYAYKNQNGQFLYTPNVEYARIRAEKLGTYDVYANISSDE